MGIARAWGLDQRVVEAAEAVCGGLHSFEFVHLGDTDLGKTSWFTRGATADTTVRLSVERSELAPVVFVVMEYLNKHVRKVGRLMWQLDCDAPVAEVREASEDLMKRVLEAYRDVLQGTGIASREAYERQVAARRN